MRSGDGGTVGDRGQGGEQSTVKTSKWRLLEEALGPANGRMRHTVGVNIRVSLAGRELELAVAPI